MAWRAERASAHVIEKIESWPERIPMGLRLWRGSIAMRCVSWAMRVARRIPTRWTGSVEKRARSMSEAEPAAPPRPVTRACTVVEMDWRGLPVYSVAPRGAGREPQDRRRMIYLHGGGHTRPIHSAHWKLVAKLAVQNDLTVIVPTFALAPDGTAAAGLDRLLGLYRELTADGGAVDYIAGDSSGGGFAYACLQRIRDEGLALPRRAFLLSPWLDVTLENPDIEELARKELILDVPTLRRFGRAWAGEHGPKSSAVSPLFGDITGLPPVHLFIGTKDIFLADCRALVRKAREVNADVRFYEYSGAFHVFMWLSWLPESRHVFRQIRKIITSDLG